MPVNIDLSSADAWDDTSLVDTWNEALKEYKKYHSIHVQGKQLSDVLSKEEMEELSRNGIEVKDKDQVNGESFEEEREQGDEYQGHDDTLLADTKIEGTLDAAMSATELPASTTNTALKNTIPDHLLNSVQDESMKNLMMAWYWAGYYTGYHDGEKASKQISES